MPINAMWRKYAGVLCKYEIPFCCNSTWLYTIWLRCQHLYSPGDWFTPLCNLCVLLIVQNSPSACKRSAHKKVCTRTAEVSSHSKLLILTEMSAVDLGSCLRWGKSTVLCSWAVTDVFLLKITVGWSLGECFGRERM